MELTKVSTTISSSGFKAVVYGGAGSGKTYQAGLLTDAGYKVLLISAEAGLRTLAKWPNIDVIDLNKFPIEKRIDKLIEAYQWIEKTKPKYDTIMIDSLTEINQCLIASLKLKYPDEKMTLKLYGENSEKMQMLCKSFRDLPYNVVLISQSEVEKDDVGRRFTIPSLIGKVSNLLPYYFDSVIFLSKDDKGNRTAQTEASNNIVAKNRGGNLLPTEPADLGKIFNKVNANKIGEIKK
jgi:hypothetical protein